MSAILHYQYSITHFAAKAKHFYREPAAKGRLPHRLLQTAGTGPAGRLAPCRDPKKQNRRPESRNGSRLFFSFARRVLGALFAH